jgi:DNA-binding response OmpR family regulator
MLGGVAKTSYCDLIKMETQIKLLVIDDNQETLAGLNDYLSKKEYEVTTAPDGLEGLKIFTADQDGFDLVITDVVMPNIGGVGVISIIKQKNPQVPVIAITGMGEHPETLAREANADVVLEKPFDLVELEKRISELIKK